MHIKGLLIDKDDTLIKLEPFWREPIHQLALRTLDDMGFAGNDRLLAAFEKAAGFHRGRLIPESPVVAGTNADIFEAWRQVLLQEKMDTFIFNSDKYRKVWMDRFSDFCYEYGTVEAYEDVLTILSEWKNQGMRIGVVTSDYFDMTMHCLQRLGIKELVDAVYTADRTKPKPDPEAALLFSQTFQLPFTQIAMIGDSANDMIFAHNAGIHGIYLDRKGTSITPPYAETTIPALIATGTGLLS